MASQKSLLAGAALAVVALLLAERRRPRRVMREAQGPRLAINLALGAMSLSILAAQGPVVRPLAQRVARGRQGLAQQLPGPCWLRDAAAFLLLDWSIYGWHVATHRVPLLWRLHRVHHADRDMDASTALRFHALDMALSIPLRAAQLRLLGVGPVALAAWERFFFASVLFHHSNLALAWDLRLALLLTTPGMHDLHHRADARALDRNFSSGLSLWDRLHGTFAPDPPAVPIGLPDTGAHVGLGASLALPFRPRKITPM